MSPYRTALIQPVASKPKKASWLSLLLWRFLSNGPRRWKASRLRRRGKLIEALIVLNKRWDELGVIDYMKVLDLWGQQKVLPGLRPGFEDYLNSHLRSGCARSSSKFDHARKLLRLQRDLQDIRQDVRRFRKLSPGHQNAIDMIMAHMKDHFGDE